ncbi:MAG TPA: GNAT family N-acetyltransferase [Tetragenococcus sp.]|nr:GNAT family N-acetyltransferase [Tetragenococcus sp.]
MDLRPIQAKDNLQIAKLIRHSLKSRGFDHPGTAYFDPYLTELSHYYQQLNHAQYWVVTDQEKIIAGAGIAPLQQIPHICELQKLYVADTYQRNGLASRLIDTALAFASQYYTACYLETHTNLGKAWSLYEKYGFVRLDTPLIDTDHTAMDRWYLKQLN